MTSYRQVLRDRRLAALIGGDAISKIGDGMGFVALPLLALELRGGLEPAVAISAAAASPFVLAIAVTLFFGMSRRRFNSRAVVAIDGVTRSFAFIGAAVLASVGLLSLLSLIVVLFAGSALRLLSSSGRRLLATGMAGADLRLPVNGLLGVSDSLALYVAGPAIGGLVSAAAGPQVALGVAGCCYATLVIAAAAARPSPAAPREESASGWRIIRRHPLALRLLVVVFLFDLLYGPVEVALPLLVTDDLGGDARALGILWTCLGGGALIGALLTNQLRRFRPQTATVVVIGGWAAALAVLAVAPNIPLAAAALFVGGAIYGPFVAIAFTFLQANLAEDEQQPVVTLYSAGITIAAPVGLGVAGPLIVALDARGGLLASALLTAALAPAVRWWIRPAGPTGPESPAAP